MTVHPLSYYYQLWCRHYCQRHRRHEEHFRHQDRHQSQSHHRRCPQPLLGRCIGISRGTRNTHYCLRPCGGNCSQNGRPKHPPQDDDGGDDDDDIDDDDDDDDDINPLSAFAEQATPRSRLAVTSLLLSSYCLSSSYCLPWLPRRRTACCGRTACAACAACAAALTGAATTSLCCWSHWLLAAAVVLLVVVVLLAVAVSKITVQPFLELLLHYFIDKLSIPVMSIPISGSHPLPILIQIQPSLFCREPLCSHIGWNQDFRIHGPGVI